MWPFRRAPEPSSDLRERIEVVERGLRDLSLDWETTYTKFHKLAARLAKAAAREEERATLPQDERTPAQAGRTITNPLARAILEGRHNGLLREG